MFSRVPAVFLRVYASFRGSLQLVSELSARALRLVSREGASDLGRGCDCFLGYMGRFFLLGASGLREENWVLEERAEVLERFSQ